MIREEIHEKRCSPTSIHISLVHRSRPEAISGDDCAPRTKTSIIIAVYSSDLAVLRTEIPVAGAESLGFERTSIWKGSVLPRFSKLALRGREFVTCERLRHDMKKGSEVSDINFMCNGGR